MGPDDAQPDKPVNAIAAIAQQSSAARARCLVQLVALKSASIESDLCNLGR